MAADSLKKLTTVLALFVCLALGLDNPETESNPVEDVSEDGEAKKAFNQGTVLFNNPKLLPQSVKEGQDAMYDFDRTQEDFNPQMMGGVNIQQEAITLGDKLRGLSNTEMGVLSMQVRSYCFQHEIFTV